MCLNNLLSVVAFHVRSPEGEVVSQELHDEGRVLVRLLGEGVELGDGVVERLLREVARLVLVVGNLVVEDGEVQREAQSDGVGRGELLVGNLGGSLVRFEGVVGRGLSGVAGGELGEVSVVVTLNTFITRKKAIPPSMYISRKMVPKMVFAVSFI